MEMTSLLAHVVLLALSFQVILKCDAQPDCTVNAVVGSEVKIPCGMKSKEAHSDLSFVWTFGQDRRTLAEHSWQNDRYSCDTTQKDCALKQDGSLVLKNVKETDTDDYYCEIHTAGFSDRYTSQHSLVVHPKAPPVAFEICPNSEDVFVYQTGPEEMVLAYTSPVCRNIDVVGSVTCDPPSGVRIGTNISEIVCRCTHSGNLVDTCKIPIPVPAPVAFEICPNSGDVFAYQTGPEEMVLAYTSPVCRNIDVVGSVTCDPPSGARIGTNISEIVCRCTHSGNLVDTCQVPIPAVTNDSDNSSVLTPLILFSILFSIFAGIVGALILWHFTKTKSEQSKSKESGTEEKETVVHAGRRLNIIRIFKGLCASLAAAPDFFVRSRKACQPTFAEMKEFIVKGGTHPKFRIMPPVDKPSDGIELKCHLCENLQLYLHYKHEEDVPAITYEPGVMGLSAGVADLVALPVHITCGNCGQCCCSLEIYGDKWNDMKEKASCKEKCDDSELKIAKEM